jgi:catechol 2,3-dioxygenase-like lactoylglutathione lyase family enzyme
MGEPISTPDVVALRPFVPATDIATSLRFYADLGFTIYPLGDALASVHLGPFAFLLQQFQAAGYADNFMMHLLVKDLDAWWARIAALDLGGRYGVRPPAAPKLQPWGLVVAYVVDPSGVLWHFAQARSEAK